MCLLTFPLVSICINTNIFKFIHIQWFKFFWSLFVYFYWFVDICIYLKHTYIFLNQYVYWAYPTTQPSVPLLLVLKVRFLDTKSRFMELMKRRCGGDENVMKKKVDLEKYISVLWKPNLLTLKLRFKKKLAYNNYLVLPF